MANGDIVFTCMGCEVADVYVPPFQMSQGEYLGLAIPPVSYASQVRVMRALGGAEGHPAILVAAGEGSVVIPETSVHKGESVMRYCLTKLASERQVSEICASEGMCSSRPYLRLGWTERLVLGLRLAWKAGARYVVFGSDGLDPCGIRRVGLCVRSHIGNGCAINVFGVSLSESADFRRLAAVDRVVSCKRV